MLAQEPWTGNPKAACSNPARNQFFTMLISCSRCSDGSEVAVQVVLKPDSMFMHNVEMCSFCYTSVPL